jgi:16S rRNA (cytosine1402-N4)-methyltransferase
VALRGNFAVHQPVLLKEVLEILQVIPGGCYVDGTLGGGGHGEPILERMEGRGLYVGIDRDPEALKRAQARLRRFGDQVRYLHGVFSDMPFLLKGAGIEKVDGILLDLGVSSFQLDEAERGFSFLKEGPLDMRMDPLRQDETAADLVNTLPEKTLIEIFQNFGEERFARRIAREIGAVRRAHPFLTTSSLAKFIQRVVPPPFGRSKIHPATRVFQALRIAVNEELKHLERFLALDFDFLKKEGRLAVISFHSLEDRQVKQAFRFRKDWKVITKKPLTAGEAELKANPRSRSAKLRAVEKQ